LTVAIVDYGMGNLRSVEKALERVGADAVISASADQIAAAEGIVLPGVGAFPRAVEEIDRRGLAGVVRDAATSGKPVLGICLGMQLLFERSSELGGAPGLGLIPGEVKPLSAGRLKLPQIGWNPVGWSRSSELTAGLPDPCAFYHVHSFAGRPSDPADALGTSTYGAPFVTAVQRGALFGVQFHPEKSGEHGLALLANFTGICAARPTPTEAAR